MRLRVRSQLRAGLVPGQPRTVPTDPDNIARAPRHQERKTCAECFGPRMTYAGRLFCARCLDEMFGWPGTQRYDRFLVTEKGRQTRLRRERASA